MILYQTVEDRNNPDEIEANAPFCCKRENSWLGDGYYFWDTLIENAHWWGEKSYPSQGYVIVEFSCDWCREKCFDLLGNMEHVKYFKEIVEFLKEKRKITKDTTVKWVIEFLKKKTDFADRYEAIRIYGHFSKSKETTEKMLFGKSSKSNQYFELTPAVQICLFRKTSLNLSKGKIVYPITYISEYVL